MACASTCSCEAECLPPKPWSEIQFMQYRSHLVSFLQKEVIPVVDRDEECSVLIRAPVKSGKREMVEYLATRDRARASCCRPRAHVFVSSWYRRAEDCQRCEISKHNITVFSLTKRESCDECYKLIRQSTDDGVRVVVHIDECDYGSANDSLMSEVWNFLHSCPLVSTILYSATPEEVMFNNMHRELDIFTDLAVQCNISAEYEPPYGYCGAARFLREGLVHEATPFFVARDNRAFIHTIPRDAPTDALYVLTNQARDILRAMRENYANTPRGTPPRCVLILRLSYAHRNDKARERAHIDDKAIYIFAKCINDGVFPEFAGADINIMFDDVCRKLVRSKNYTHSAFDWSSEAEWRRINSPTIIVIDQTASRSTEFACHNRIYAMHDFRFIHQYTAVSQAQERANHYEQKHGAFQPIHIYGHVKTFALSARLIGHEQYLAQDWSWRVVSKEHPSGRDGKVIKDGRALSLAVDPRIISPRARHPWVPYLVSKEEACDMNKIFMGMFRSLISDRVYAHRVYYYTPTVRFVPCNRASFYECVGRKKHECRNPFVYSDARMNQYPDLYPRSAGQIGRNPQTQKWCVLHFEDREMFNSSFKVTSEYTHYVVCYRGEELGVAVCTLSGELVHERGILMHTAKTSMYSCDE